MSADNWATCPKCNKKAAAKEAKRLERIKQSYGKIPEVDYLALCAEKQRQPEEPTVREYYEIGIYEDRFQISYSGSCDNCDFKFSYKHEEQISEEEE